MNKGKIATLAAVCAICFLAACSGKASADTASGEMVAPEVSSEDLLVSSLEYLLEEDGEEAEQKPEETVEDQAKPQETETEKIPEQEETAESAEQETEGKTVEISYGKDMESGLLKETITLDEVTPEALLAALARHNIVPLLNMKVLSLEEQETDGGRILYLDLSDTFREYLLTMSEDAECIIMASVVNTFLANYDADAMYIMIEGEPLATSHAAYTQALYDDTPGEMHRFMMQGASETETVETAGQ